MAASPAHCAVVVEEAGRSVGPRVGLAAPFRPKSFDRVWGALEGSDPVEPRDTAVDHYKVP